MRGPDGLNPDDPGMRLLGAVATSRQAEAMRSGEGVLLAHCGDVPQAGAAARRWILDVRERVDARHHCVDTVRDLEALRAHTGPVKLALNWPRAHLGLDFAYWSLAAAAACLEPGGWLLCAARKQKGGKRLRAFMAALLGEAEVLARGSGYQVVGAMRGESLNTSLLDETLAASYAWPEIDLELEGVSPVALRAGPGVFARRGLDEGTEVLLTHLMAHADHMPTPRNIVDLCAGVGPLGVIAARLFPEAEVLAVDSNLLAVDDLRANVAANDLATRVVPLLFDGMPPAGAVAATGAFEGRVDLVLMNPPTHAPRPVLEAMVRPLRAYLTRNARVLAVVNRAGTMRAVFKRLGARGTAYDYEGYTILEARFDGAPTEA